jgi:hypothetical protein
MMEDAAMTLAVDTLHEQVQRFLVPWRTVTDAVTGARAIKAAGEQYLPMLSWPPDRRVKEYDAYRMRAVFADITKHTHRGLVGLVFRKPPQVSVPDALAYLLNDVTLTGTTFPTFAKLVFSEVVAPGRCGVLVDQAANDPATPAEPQPYLTWYRAQNILNWWTMRVEGRQMLARVVLREEVWDATDDPFAPRKVEQLRVVQLVPGGAPPGYEVMPNATPRWLQHVVYRQAPAAASEAGWVPVQQAVIHRRGVALNFIPFVFVNPTTIEPDCEEPPLLGLAELNISMYQNSADLENGRHWTGRPQPYLFGVTLNPGESINYGSQKVWTSTNENAKAGFAEFSGQGLGALERAIQEKKQLAVELGARLVQPGQVAVTATEAMLRSIAEHSILSSMVGATSAALTEALLYQVWWANGVVPLDELRGEVTVALNNEFTASIMSAADAEAWARTTQLGNALSERDLFELLKRGGVYPPERTYAEHRALLALDSAGTGGMGDLDAIDPTAPPVTMDDGQPPTAPRREAAAANAIAGATG